jgi:hypothetical protein
MGTDTNFKLECIDSIEAALIDSGIGTPLGLRPAWTSTPLQQRPPRVASIASTAKIQATRARQKSPTAAGWILSFARPCLCAPTANLEMARSCSNV